MSPAEEATTRVIEETLGSAGSYQKIDDRLYIIKQGSSYVMINIVPWGENRALVRCVAQLVKGVDMDKRLSLELLTMNAHLRFGAFAFDPAGQLILFIHSILGGETLDPDELLATVTDVALIADDYDDRIIKKYGGSTMRDLLEQAAFERLIDTDPDAVLAN